MWIHAWRGHYVFPQMNLIFHNIIRILQVPVPDVFSFFYTIGVVLSCVCDHNADHSNVSSDYQYMHLVADGSNNTGTQSEGRWQRLLPGKGLVTQHVYMVTSLTTTL